MRAQGRRIRCLANILWGAFFAPHRMRGSQMIDLIQVARVRGGSPALTPAGPYAAAFLMLVRPGYCAGCGRCWIGQGLWRP